MGTVMKSNLTVPSDEKMPRQWDSVRNYHFEISRLINTAKSRVSRSLAESRRVPLSLATVIAPTPTRLSVVLLISLMTGGQLFCVPHVLLAIMYCPVLLRGTARWSTINCQD
ncbi:hypothetical protein ElyMa_000650700 [Elysia marginata]|uniref:Uncharacterized protein n=1 Tax=Elysia marginata TaxID=1093978 RepID=A0AAV4GFR4_9GAST|nr:hypothetical protein ElyMa_000650700 [Elysia marginata]